MSRRDLPPPYSSLGFPAAAAGAGARAGADATIVIVEEAPPEYTADDEQALLAGDLFADKTTRLGFTQKVLAAKLLQLLGMAAVMALFVVNHREVIWFMERKNNMVELLVMSNIIYMLNFGLLIACSELRRTNPARYMFLVVYPLSLALYICAWTVYWHLLPAILLSFAYYCVVVFVLLLYSVFASQTSLEFVTKHGIITAVGLQVIMCAVTLPFLNIEPVYVLCPSVLMLLEYVYLLYELEIMTSRTYWYDFKPTDFVDATINLNIDYFNILYNYACPCMCNAMQRFFKLFKGVEEAVALMR